MLIVQRIYNLFGKFFPSKHKKEAGHLTILSSNCIAGRVYHDFGLRFDSPTINLYFDAESFLKFVSNVDYYLNETIEVTQEKHCCPVGIIHDVKINFLHYKTAKEAKDKWEERKKRFDASKVFVVMTDRDGFDYKMIDQLDRIPYKKLIFTSKKIDRDYAVYMPEFDGQNSVGVMTNFYKFSRKRYYELHFDFKKWLFSDFSVKECTFYNEK